MDVFNIISVMKEKEKGRKKVICRKLVFKKKYYIIKIKIDKMKELDIFKDEIINVIENFFDCGNC